MRVLDIDLDYFQLGIVIGNQSDERPSAEDYPPWAPERVAAFLEARCGLTSVRKLQGHRVESHDQVFDLWRDQIRAGELAWPFDVVHVDAHADLSVGNPGWHHVCTDLLYADPEERCVAGRPSALNEGNYLLFAVACRWVRALTYVYHPEVSMLDELPSDLMSVLFRDRDRHSGLIELPCFATEDKDRDDLAEGGAAAIRREPPVPIRLVAGSALETPGPFDFAYLSISPSYTSAAAEDLIEVIAEYIQFE